MNEIGFNILSEKYIGKKVGYLLSFPIKDKLFFVRIGLYNSIKSETLFISLVS